LNLPTTFLSHVSSSDREIKGCIARFDQLTSLEKSFEITEFAILSIASDAAQIELVRCHFANRRAFNCNLYPYFIVKSHLIIVI
jgi:hypothetical protein